MPGPGAVRDHGVCFRVGVVRSPLPSRAPAPRHSPPSY